MNKLDLDIKLGGPTWCEKCESYHPALPFCPILRVREALERRINMSYSVGGGNVEANANLIAAAPELLEDLESRYAQTKCGCGHPACNRCEDDRETERVLLKAKGGRELNDNYI